MPHRFVDLKRFHVDGACYFVTIKTKGNFPYFRETFLCDLFLEELRLSKRLKGFELFGWVICNDHAHLMIRPGDKWNISKIMFSIKKQFSHNVNRVMGYNPISIHTTPPTLTGDRPTPVGAQALARLQAMDNGYQKTDICTFDTMVEKMKNQFAEEHPNHNPFPKFQWQKSFYDHYCRNETGFRNCLEYIAYNPIKHNLPTDWPYVFTNPKLANLIDPF